MLRITREEVEAFAAASGDRSPLHVSPEYARTTAFGRPIAHGVLGLLTAARELPARPGMSLKRIAVEFPRPLLLDTDYAVEVREDGPDACTVEVRDGSKPAIRAVLEFGPSRATAIELVGELGLRTVAANGREFTRGQVVGGRYSPLAMDWMFVELPGRGIERSQVLALMLCSYVIGMELPGELALFTRLALEFDAAPHGGPLTWAAQVDGWQPRTGALRVGLDLLVGDVAWAKASLRAFVRATAEVTAAPAAKLEPRAFADKTAVVIGASRGLGRSLADGFAAHGGRVLAVSRATGTDASDPDSLGQALAELDGIDLLICNASPPLQPLTLEPATAARVLEHIHDAVALVATPLALCLPRLARAHGVALLSSSIAVDHPPTEWAHYVAGKRAGEALFEVAASQYPDVGFVIARLPRLDTGFSLNVTGEPAASVAEIAARLLERLAGPHPERGQIELLTRFDRA